MRRSKAPPLGRNFVANPLPSPTSIPYRGGGGGGGGGWGVTLIGVLQLQLHSLLLLKSSEAVVLNRFHVIILKAREEWREGGPVCEATRYGGQVDSVFELGV